MLALCGSSNLSGSRSSAENASGPGAGSGSGSNMSSLSQLLLESDVEKNANMIASTSGESALVHLASLITQTTAAKAGGTGPTSGPSSYATGGTGAPPSTGAVSGGGGLGNASNVSSNVIASGQAGSGPNKPLFTSS